MYFGVFSDFSQFLVKYYKKLCFKEIAEETTNEVGTDTTLKHNITGHGSWLNGSEGRKIKRNCTIITQQVIWH